MVKMFHAVNESLSGICSSNLWDIDLTWNSPDPNFTVCFEKTILVWSSCAFLWLFLPEQLYRFRTASAFNIPFNLYNKIKLLSIGLLIKLALFNIVTYAFSERHVPVDIITPTIKFFTFCLFLYLTFENIKRGIRSSGTLFIFSFLLAFLGAPEFRSKLKLTYGNEIYDEDILEVISYLIYYPLVLNIFFLNCFADARPTITTYPLQKNVCPEYDVSFLSQILFSWVDSFMWKGYKTVLTEDLIWNLDYEMDPARIASKFESRWRRALDRVKKKAADNKETQKLGVGEAEGDESTAKEASIMGPLWQTFGWNFGFGVTLKVIQSCLQFFNPLVLNLLIAFVNDENEYLWHGYVYAVLFLVIAFSQTILLMKHFQYMYRVGLQIRTAMISVIYKKALKISNGGRKHFTIGQIVNLMAVDAQRFTDLMFLVPLVWIVPLEIALAVYFLWQILGPSVLAGLALLIILIPINGFIASRIQKLQIMQMRRKDERVKLINEILSGIKVLKLYAWEPSFEKQVVRIRDKEIEILRHTAYLKAVSSFVLACAPFLVSLVTFAAFVWLSDENVLDAQTAFVSLSLFNILRFPLTVLPIVISDLVQANVAIKRIDKFLNAEEINFEAISHENRPDPISVENGQFSWDGYDASPTLININVKVEPGSLVAVVGAVGAGKSSLLSALLGEMYKQSGSVNTHGSIAYVPQQAWIRNATLKDNITLGDKANDTLYDQVVEACALIADLKILPGGDQTEIGAKGINLSGGQKQRVSLARAVYSNSDIYLLDDPLSAVDANVGKSIFDNVIGPNGLLKNKTRILVTHGVAYLPQTDFIIVLQDGAILESGTYTELMDKKGNFADFLTTYQTTSEESTDKRSESYLQENETSENVDSSIRDTIKEYDVEPDETVVIGQRLTEIEHAATGTIKWSVFLFYFKSAGFFYVITTVLMNILNQVFSVGGNIWLTIWSGDTTIEKGGPHSQYFYLAIYAAFGCGQAATIVCETIVMFLGMLIAANFIHRHLLTSILRWPVGTFDTVPSGRIINRFGFDIDVLDNVLPRNVMQFLNSTALVVSTFFMITYSTPVFLCVVIPIMIIYFCVQRFYAATSRQMKRAESVSKSPVYSHFEETVSGAASIRAYLLQSKFIHTSEEKVAVTQKCSYGSFIATRWLAIRLQLLGSFVVLFSAIFIVLGRYTITASLVGLSISYALQVTDTLSYWAQLMTEAETNVVAVERIKEYSEVKHEAPWILPNKVVPKEWPDQGAIIFQELQARYRTGLPLVLKGISFEVHSGEKVGIVGRTGAGKSSLTLCLFRLVEAAGGAVIIDGLDISKLGLHTLRARLTIIPQDPVLFTGKLRTNLDPNEAYSDESIWRALELANLKTVVSNLTFGLQHEVTEGGGNFSVGQRQLICLARALLRKTKILILDEATAAVDMETDDLIQATIKKEFEDCTVLTIAHRLNTVLDYDRIVVLDEGRVVENDSPQTLIESEQSFFSKMAKHAGLI